MITIITRHILSFVPLVIMVSFMSIMFIMLSFIITLMHNCLINFLYLPKVDFDNLTRVGKIVAVITQNVDNLHFKAGSKDVVELHGSAFKVICLSCDYSISRHDYQNVLKELNSDMEEVFSMIRPDGDVEISQDKIDKFEVSPCPKCNSPLKPDIIFFGDNVPRERVQLVRDKVTSSDALLVLGSSLSVFSSYRIIVQAKEENKSVAVVNIGPTRADPIIDLKISTKCGDALQMLKKHKQNGATEDLIY